MPFYISETLRKAVFERVARAEGNGRYLHVYEAAQEIQNAYPAENAALEDIVAAFVDCAAGRPIAIELSQPIPHGQIPIEVIVVENP
jgi:hypothetical protein